jgi:phosphohistidine phosphatase
VAPVTRLWLLRHAKSRWDDPHLPDRLRPLAPRGHRAVATLARHLRATAVAPGLVLCSPARRAVQTWEGVASGVPPGTPVTIDEAIYGADSDELLARLREVPARIGSALLIGHNPEVQDLAVDLVGSGDAGLRERLVAKFPTGALATLEAPGDWRDLAWGAATLLAFVVPREL